MRTVKALALLIASAFAACAHVGSPDIYLDGQAGPVASSSRFGPLRLSPAWRKSK